MIYFFQKRPLMFNCNRNEGMMEGTLLLALPKGMLIDQIQPTDTGLAITVISTSAESCCTLCSQASSSVHSHYQRTLSDVLCAGQQVELSLTVRRFYCYNSLCERKVFTERMPRFPECSTPGLPTLNLRRIFRSITIDVTYCYLVRRRNVISLYNLKKAMA